VARELRLAGPAGKSAHPCRKPEQREVSDSRDEPRLRGRRRLTWTSSAAENSGVYRGSGEICGTNSAVTSSQARLGGS
jgi:hypothetical protein